MSWLAPEVPDLVWLRGADAVRFVNDLISQEIATAEPGTVHRSLLLGPQGKLDHILWALKGEEEVGLVTDPGLGEALATTLERYRIRVDVKIEQEQAPSWLVVGDAGVAPGRWERIGGGLEADVSWRQVRRVLVVGEKPDVRGGNQEEYEAARIASGEPRWGMDVDERTIPQETGLVEASIDFDKGCFLGQELVARIDSRGGQVPRRLRVLELDGEGIEVEAPVLAGEKEVGKVSSVSGRLALASIRREVSPGDTVTVGGNTALVREVE